VQQAAALRLTAHEQVKLVDGCTTGPFKYHRVEKIRPALEHAHPASGAAVPTGKRGRDQCLALP
jgi:hypothetical protein